jgi:hypothetical protein
MYDFLAAQAAAGTQPWTRLWQEGHGRTWQRNADYIDQHAEDWASALLG